MVTSKVLLMPMPPICVTIETSGYFYAKFLSLSKKYYCIDTKPGNDGNFFLNNFSYNVFLDPKNIL